MPRKPAHGGPEEWMQRATSSLALAKLHGADVMLEDHCYQAQQAAEKALKALYIARGKEFLFTHDLDRLIAGLEEMGIPIPPEVDQAADLTRYALETRYPGDFEPVDESEYQGAIQSAETVLSWVKTQLDPEDQTSCNTLP